MKNKTLVLGASLNAERYSNKAIKRLVANGVPTLAHGRTAGEVAGISIETERVKYSDVDTVTLYLRPSLQASFETYLLELKPRRVIFNPGTENSSLETKLNEHGIETTLACTLVLLTTKQY
ncbi:conserved hypothetical protein [Tenacibaculum litopenaei]|uniref:CoA-binding protein n=1 Tax=Tenacibaculum litopenaei TaxID=396016 RepID=UPI003893A6C5